MSIEQTQTLENTRVRGHLPQPLAKQSCWLGTNPDGGKQTWKTKAVALIHVELDIEFVHWANFQIPLKCVGPFGMGLLVRQLPIKKARERVWVTKVLLWFAAGQANRQTNSYSQYRWPMSGHCSLDGWIFSMANALGMANVLWLFAYPIHRHGFSTHLHEAHSCANEKNDQKINEKCDGRTSKQTHLLPNTMVAS